ncbi:MAG: hypothetical protein ACYTFG_05985, partial [Planctomycetota bacterium]
IEDLAGALADHKAHLESGDGLVRKRRKTVLKRIHTAADAFFRGRLWAGNESIVNEAVDGVARGEMTPAQAAHHLFEAVFSEREGRKS